MLAAQLDKPPAGPDWTFEVKFDGIRAFAVIDRGVLTLVSRTRLGKVKVPGASERHEWTGRTEGKSAN
jgi:hypothetical protein